MDRQLESDVQILVHVFRCIIHVQSLFELLATWMQCQDRNMNAEVKIQDGPKVGPVTMAKMLMPPLHCYTEENHRFGAKQITRSLRCHLTLLLMQEVSVERNLNKPQFQITHITQMMGY